MAILFPKDFKNSDKQENPRVASFLVKNFTMEYQAGVPAKEIVDYVSRLLVYLDEKKPWAVVVSKAIAPPTLMLIARWTVIAYACTKEMRAVYASYTDIVDSIRSDGELADAARRTPFLIVLFPELVQNADWATAKFLDMIIQKKNVVIMTTNPKKLGKIFGDVVMQTIEFYTGADGAVVF